MSAHDSMLTIQRVYTIIDPERAQILTAAIEDETEPHFTLDDLVDLALALVLPDELPLLNSPDISTPS